MIPLSASYLLEKDKDMGEFIFVVVLGLFGVWLGVRFARRLNRRKGKRIEKPLPAPLDRMGDMEKHDE